MKTIELQSWPRRSQYEFFRGVAQPHFSLTAVLDATHLAEVLKPRGVSLFNGALFAIMAAANSVPELRTRFRGDQVVEHEAVGASFTVPIGDEGFAFCEVEFTPDWAAFDARCSAAVEAAKQQQALVDKVSHQDQWIFLSCLPWISFTAMTNPRHGPDDCIPRITWGRFTRQGDRWQVPVGIGAHHALVDGLHIGRFYQELERRLAADFDQGQSDT